MVKRGLWPCFSSCTSVEQAKVRFYICQNYFRSNPRVKKNPNWYSGSASRLFSRWKVRLKTHFPKFTINHDLASVVSWQDYIWHSDSTQTGCEATQMCPQFCNRHWKKNNLYYLTQYRNPTWIQHYILKKYKTELRWKQLKKAHIHH